MRSTELPNWEVLKRDVGKWLKKGLIALERGTLVVKRRDAEQGEDAKRQYKLMALKTQAHNAICELGISIYSLIGTKKKNPCIDARVKDLTAHIRRYESEISELESKQRKVKKRKNKKAA